MKDPGIDRKKSHPLENIILISIAAIICGAETWDEIEDFGYVKFDWLSGFLNMQNGVPSHDTFNRFFSLLDPNEFEKHFISWTQSIVSKYDCEFVSVDGKSLNRASKMLDNGNIHIVNARASLNEVALGQFKTSEKSNEITAIPSLLDSLFLENCIVSLDAMGCQKKIAEKIRERKADYILSVKENHSTLYEEVRSCFSSLQAEEVSMPIEADHGRIENRQYFLIKNLNHITGAGEWQDLKSLVKVESERIIKKTREEQRESRYFITSLTDIEKSAQGVRLHWGVENKLGSPVKPCVLKHKYSSVCTERRLCLPPLSRKL
jgi:predicted transposase YbfD/YdcC